jgi:hypothetical protein
MSYRNFGRRAFAYILLMLPALWLTDMFVGWFYQGFSGPLQGYAIPIVFVMILWPVFFYLGDRWEAVTSYALFFCGFMMLLNGGMMAFELKAPPPRPPFLAMTAQSEAAFRDIYDLDRASLSRPRVPSWPLPVLIFVALFGGVSVVAGGWTLLWKGQAPNERALEELEEKYPLLKGFSERYSRELAPWMEAQEKRRRAAIRHRLAVYLGGVIGLGALILALGKFDIGSYTLHADMAIVGAYLYLLYKFAEMPVNRLKEEVKGQLTGEVCRFLGLGYSPAAGSWDMKRFEDMHLLPRYDVAYPTDVFSGLHGKVSFRICSAKLITTGKHGGTEFVGALVEMTFPEAFSGNTKILTDRGKIVNKLMDALIVKEKRVGLSYSSFEKDFEVYSTDQVEARALLTPDVLENVMKLSQLLSGENALQAAFQGRSLLLSISCDRALFDMGGMGTPMTDTRRVSRFVEEVAVVHNIIDTIGVQKRARG